MSISRRKFVRDTAMFVAAISATDGSRTLAEDDHVLAQPEKSQIGYSTMGFPDRDVEAALDVIAAVGFARVELLGQEPHIAVPLVGDNLKEFRQRLEKRGLTAGTVHAPLTRNVLGAPEEAWRREKVEVLASYIRFTGAIGFTSIVIHPIPNPIFVPNPKHPDLPRRMRDAVPRSLDELVPIAQKTGVCILMENLPYVCDYPFLTMDELKPLADRYPPDALGLVVDTGHARILGRDPAGEILKAGSRLGGTHLQDVDGAKPEDSHWLPTHGDLDWHSIRVALAKVHYRGNWTFEVVTPRHGETPAELARLAFAIGNKWAKT